jgi:hypothetical protein
MPLKSTCKRCKGEMSRMFFRTTNPRIIEETRQYIRDFDRIPEMTTTAQELYDKMLELYPNRVNPGWALWSSARAVKLSSRS